MYRRILFAAFAAILLCSIRPALAQDTGTLAGTVTDSTTGETIPGANVVIDELDQGAATGADGAFRISGIEPGSYTLVASFVGYQAKTVPVEINVGETTEVDIQLASEAIGMQDLVVTALGVEREERSLGYSIESVEGAELSKVPETNFVSSLAGRVAGAQFNQSNSIGGSTRIVLRGPNSVTGDNQPLFVIDGVVLNNPNLNNDRNNLANTGQASGGGGYDYGNPAQVVNPQNIESISVLKGASAAALYGSRGANGVIEITTKNGSTSDGIGVNVSTGVMFRSVYGLPEYQNEYGGGADAPFFTTDGDLLLEEGEQLVADYGTDQSWGPRMDGREVRQWYSWDNVNGLEGVATPWVPSEGNVQDYFNTGAGFNTTVALSQNGEVYNYRVALSNVTEAGTYPNSRLERYQVSFNGQFDVTDKLTTSAVGNYAQSSGEGRPGTGYDGKNVFLQFNHFGQRQVDLGPNSYMADYARPDGSQRGWNWRGVEGAQNGNFFYTDNPYWVQEVNFPTDDSERVYGRVQTQYEFNEQFRASAQVGTDYYTERREQRTAVTSVGESQFYERIIELQETSGQLRVDFDDQFGADDQYSVSALAATEYRYEDYSNNEGITQGGLAARNIYTLENSRSSPTVEDYFEERAVASVFGQATFGWQNTVFVDATLRNDWSSTLPEGSNSFLYPGVSASFIFTEVVDTGDILNYGKIRAGWSEAGNDTEPYRLALTYPLGNSFNDEPVQRLPEQLPNSELKPEITTSFEVGTNLEFFNNRVALDFTYYRESTRDQIIPIEVSRSSGFITRVVNAGKIINRGAEVSLSATPLITEDFQWDVVANWAKNVSTVDELAEGVTTVTLGNSPFGPDIVAQVGQPYGAIYGTDFVYDANGNKVLTSSGTYRTSDPEIIGSYVPDWTGGLSNTLSYKGWSASALINGQYGGDIYSVSNLFGLYSGIYQYTAEDNIRELGLIPEGVTVPDGEDPSEVVGERFTDRIDANAFFTGTFSAPDAAQVYDATYIKLAELTLGYTLPAQWFAGTPVQNFTVLAVGRNLATLYRKTPNFDPSTALSAGNVQGIEAGQIPPSRSYGFRLNVSF